MKKQLKIGVIVILLIVGLSGCNETNKNGTNIFKEKILGTWLANVTTGPGRGSTGIYYFLSNGSFLAISDIRAWGTFEITNKKLNMSGDGITYSYNYTFSDNYNKVTLIDNYWTIILLKQ